MVLDASGNPATTDPISALACAAPPADPLDLMNTLKTPEPEKAVASHDPGKEAPTVLNATTNQAAIEPVFVDIPNALTPPVNTTSSILQPNATVPRLGDSSKAGLLEITSPETPQTDIPTPSANPSQPQRPKMVKNGSHWSIRVRLCLPCCYLLNGLMLMQGEWPSGLRA